MAATATFDVDSLLGELADEAERTLADSHGDPDADPVWRWEPAPFEAFVEGEEHLALPPFYPRQYAAVHALLGRDPKRIFDPPTPAQDRPVEWQKVRSSNVRAIAHHAETLYVDFGASGVYAYPAIAANHYEQLAHARSVGRALKKLVDGRDYTKLKVAADELTYAAAQQSARMYQLAVLLWGKGSGKDYICSVLVAYLVHVLLCLRDPQAFFEFAPGENIDIVNVAYSADQAKLVFFEKLKERFKRWRWLRQNFDVWEAGRRVDPATAGRPKVDIKDNEVHFPRKIRALSRHSENEAYEGLNIIAWLMDEASAFLSKAKRENANAIYQTLRTSAGSRFGTRWIGFIISYPRHADDFTMTMAQAGRDNPSAGIYVDGPAATWDVNARIAKGQWVEVRPGFKVPVSLANDFELDFEESLAKYCCQPPLARDALIKQPERLWQAVAKGRRPTIEYEETVTEREVPGPDGEPIKRRFSAVKLTRLGPLPRGTKLFWHGDPAYRNDAFSLALGHAAPATIVTWVPASEVLTRAQILEQGLTSESMVQWEKDVARTVIDSLIVWRPDPKNGIEVDLLNVRAVLMDVCKAYRIGAGSFDQYNSADTVQLLQAKKVPVENETWSNPFQFSMYRQARAAFYNDLVTLPDQASVTSKDPRKPGAIFELERVEEIEGHKVDHPEGGSKDSADAVVRVIQHVQDQLQRGFTFASAPTTPVERPAPEGQQAPGRKVDAGRTASPIGAAERAAEAERQRTRPEGVVENATGKQGGKFSFGRASPRR